MDRDAAAAYNTYTPPGHLGVGERSRLWAASLLLAKGAVMKTHVYVDGFNLYYGIKQAPTPYRWVDLGKLFKFLLPTDNILKIRYFTAHVQPTPVDPSVHQRQQTYLRALRTIPHLCTHLGSFLPNPRTLPAYPLANPPKFVQVWKTEEKGSDVNLACHLLMDCEDKACDHAVVVSADSDLVLPVELARTRSNVQFSVMCGANIRSREV